MSERDLIGAVEGVRKVIQDLLAPEVRALVVRVDSLEKQFELKLNAAEERTGARIDALGARVDAVEQRLDTRIDSLEEHMNLRFDAVDARFNGVDARFDRLEASIKDFQMQMMVQFNSLINYNIITERLNKLETQVQVPPQAPAQAPGERRPQR